MTELETLARRHAEAVHAALEDVEVPSVEELPVHGRGAGRWRGAAVAAVAVAAILTGVLVVPNLGSDRSDPAASVPAVTSPPPGEATVTPSVPPARLPPFDTESFVASGLEGILGDDAEAVAVVGLVPEVVQENVEQLAFSRLGLNGWAFAAPDAVADAADEFAAASGTARLEGRWAAIGLLAESPDPPVDYWLSTLLEVPNVVAATTEFAPREPLWTEAWTPLGELPFSAGGPAIAAAADDRVVLLGTNQAWVVGTDATWSQASPLPLPAQCCAALNLMPAGDTVALIVDETSVGTWIFDHSGLTWRRADPRPTRGGILGSAVVDGELIVVDAAPRTPDAVSTVAALDLQTLEWRELEPVPQPVSVGGVTSDGERLLVGGTHQDSGNLMYGPNAAFAYTIDEGWRELGEIPISGQASTVAWIDGAGLLAWNYDLHSRLLDESGEWQPAGNVPMSSAECYPSSMVVATGAVGMCGGLAWFDAATRQWSRIMTPDVNPGAVYVATDEALFQFVPAGEGETSIMSTPLPPGD